MLATRIPIDNQHVVLILWSGCYSTTMQIQLVPVDDCRYSTSPLAFTVQMTLWLSLPFNASSTPHCRTFSPQMLKAQTGSRAHPQAPMKNRWQSCTRLSSYAALVCTRVVPTLSSLWSGSCTHRSSTASRQQASQFGMERSACK